MHKALSFFAMFILMLGLAAGCKEDAATQPSGSASKTAGDEGSITMDSDGKEWVTPDAAATREQAEEEGVVQDEEETEMVSPMNVPGMNEFE